MNSCQFATSFTLSVVLYNYRTLITSHVFSWHWCAQAASVWRPSF